MNRPKGMHPRAFDALIQACYKAQVAPTRVVQTLGNAAASAGTHGKDGSFDLPSGGSENYSAAVDLSVKHPRITAAQRESLLRNLWDAGFAAWYRNTGSFVGNEHVHAVFVGLPMKRSLRNQVHSFLAHRSGLVGDKADAFVRDNLSEAAEQHLRTMFLQSGNPITG